MSRVNLSLPSRIGICRNQYSWTYQLMIRGYPHLCNYISSIEGEVHLANPIVSQHGNPSRYHCTAASSLGRNLEDIGNNPYIVGTNTNESASHKSEILMALLKVANESIQNWLVRDCVQGKGLLSTLLISSIDQAAPSAQLTGIPLLERALLCGKVQKNESPGSLQHQIFRNMSHWIHPAGF